MANSDAQRVNLSMLAGALDLKIFQNDVMMRDLRKRRRLTSEQKALRTDADMQLAYLVFELRECAALSKQFTMTDEAALLQEKQLAKAGVLLDETVAGGVRAGIHLPTALLVRWEAEHGDHLVVCDEQKRLKKSGSLHRWMKSILLARTTKRIEKELEACV